MSDAHDQAAEREDALRAIGSCWAGGELTGKALELFAARKYAEAKAVALEQIAQQDDGLVPAEDPTDLS